MASSSVSDPHHLENPRGDDRAAGAHPVSSGRAVKKGRAGEPQGTHMSWHLFLPSSLGLKHIPKVRHQL